MSFAFVGRVILSSSTLYSQLEFLDWKSSGHMCPLPLSAFEPPLFKNLILLLRLFTFLLPVLEGTKSFVLVTFLVYICVLQRQIANLNHYFLCKRCVTLRGGGCVPKRKPQFLVLFFFCPVFSTMTDTLNCFGSVLIWFDLPVWDLSNFG